MDLSVVGQTLLLALTIAGLYAVTAPQVIATKNQPLGRQTRNGDMPEDKIAERLGTHAGVSAELINLVAGRFQQQQRSRFPIGYAKTVSGQDRSRFGARRFEVPFDGDARIKRWVVFEFAHRHY